MTGTLSNHLLLRKAARNAIDRNSIIWKGRIAPDIIFFWLLT